MPAYCNILGEKPTKLFIHSLNLIDVKEKDTILFEENVSGYSRNPCSLSRERDTA